MNDLAYDKSIPLKYISFASYNNTPIEFFYDCSMQPSYINTQVATRYANPGHPILLEDPPFETPVDKRNCKWFYKIVWTNWILNDFFVLQLTTGLTSRCKTYTNTKYEYKDFIKLSDIRDSHASGYIVRLVFYAQGTRNAHVLLSQTPNPKLATEPVYEFSK